VSGSSTRKSAAALLYHEIQPGSDTSNSYALTRAQFEEQLRFLAENGYRSGSFREFWGDGGGEDGDRTVIITFDDAHLTNYTEAFPALEKYGMTACFYIPTAFIAKTPSEVTIEHLTEMARHGNEIQSHSHSHPFLNSLTREEVLDELRRSREILEQGLGSAVDQVACPGGRYNSTVLDAAREAGYRAVCTSKPGYNRRRPGAGFYIFDRILMAGGTPPEDFERFVAQDRRALTRRRAAYGVKSGLRSVLGDRLYHRIWEKVWWPS
jgi:peptidoglycan/xylan/chitin deacetylase (PgdA/CDA1 family)